jgi:hypothetical protein
MIRKGGITLATYLIATTIDLCVLAVETAMKVNERHIIPEKLL